MRDRAQGCQVEGAMMGRTIFSYQSGTVEAEHYRQVEECHVVDDIVVGTLCKRTVDVAERYQSILCHTTREGDCMSLGDTYIEGAVWHRLHHDVHRASGRHGWRHTYDLRVLLGKFQQGLSEDILKLRRLVAVVGNDSLAGFRVKLAWCMPDGSTLLGWFVSLALGGMQVEQLRSFHVSELLQDSYHFLYIMTVEWSEVSDVHSLEDVLLLCSH